MVDGVTEIGDENVFYPFSSIGLQTQDLKWVGGLTRTLIGHRNTFRENVTVHSATSDGECTLLGDDNHLLAYTHVAHNVEMGSRIIMSNVATLGGHVHVEDGAVIGGLAAVHQFCRIGKMSIIGGCSKVVQDVPPYFIADGNPAVCRGVNKVGLERRGVDPEIQQAIKKVYRTLIREKLPLKEAVDRIRADFGEIEMIRHFADFVDQTERGICRP